MTVEKLISLLSKVDQDLQVKFYEVNGEYLDVTHVNLEFDKEDNEIITLIT